MAIKACPDPECGSANVYKRLTKTPAWRCSECNSTFDEPIYRTPKDTTRP